MAEDKNLTCRDCGKTFVFTAGEQVFFAEKGLSDPIRCPECRRLRKQQRMMEAVPAGSPAPRYESGPRPSTPRPSEPGSFRSNGPPGPNDRTPAVPSAPRTGGARFNEEDDESGRNYRKARPAASVAAKYAAPRKEHTPVPKEKRPNNRRDQEKLLLNWKEEVGLNDEPADDWLPKTESEE